MCRTLVFWICLLLVPPGIAMAQTKAPAAKQAVPKKSTAKESGTKELSGMSIVGNDEAPKALYIVPWKSSEMGGETSMKMMLDGSDKPVDREVFMRQLNFYEVSTGKK